MVYFLNLYSRMLLNAAWKRTFKNTFWAEYARFGNTIIGKKWENGIFIWNVNIQHSQRIMNNSYLNLWKRKVTVTWHRTITINLVYFSFFLPIWRPVSSHIFRTNTSHTTCSKRKLQRYTTLVIQVALCCSGMIY